jgi:ribosomal protein L21E
MANKKPVRTRGKVSLSRYFQELNKGDSFSVSREQSVAASFPKRFQGITGKVEGMRGEMAVLAIKDGNKEKRLLILPIHLKKIK